MDADWTSKVCIVTGANRGIGKATAAGLAERGATVILACRDEARAGRAREEIAAATGNDRIEVELVDLASQRSIRDLADRVRTRYDALHVLVNNAGIIRSDRTETEDGVETTIAVNHLAYFLLSNLLLKTLEAGAPSRIVNVSSDAHRRVDGLEDLQSERSYDGWTAYCKSKLANVYFTYQLAQRLGGTGVTTNCLHPGVIDTGLVRETLRMRALFRMLGWLVRPMLKSPDQGARTTLHVATSDELGGVSGKYFRDRKEVRSSPVSYDEIIANQLWERSLELTARSR